MENECSKYGNGYSSAGSSVVVDRPTQPETLPNLEAEASYVTPKSSDLTFSRRHGRLAPNTDIGRIPQSTLYEVFYKTFGTSPSGGPRLERGLNLSPIPKNP